MSTKLQTKVREFFGNDEDAVKKWANTDRETWAELGGINLTGRMKEADSGFDFAEKIAELDVKDLMNLRFELRDHFLDSFVNGSPNAVESPTTDVIRGLVDILEAEIGGRWVS